MPDPVRPVAPREAFLLEALAAARDVLATFAKQAGYLPEQGGYSTRMTEGQMALMRAVADIDQILAVSPVPWAGSGSGEEELTRVDQSALSGRQELPRKPQPKGSQR